MLDLGGFGAILCDLDGVLVDSHVAIERGYDEWADARGLSRERVRELFPGTPARQVVEQADPSLNAAAEALVIDRIHVSHGDEVRASRGRRRCWKLLPHRWPWSPPAAGSLPPRGSRHRDWSSRPW